METLIPNGLVDCGYDSITLLYVATCMGFVILCMASRMPTDGVVSFVSATAF